MARFPNKLPLPNTTIQAFRAKGKGCQNIGLIFDRYLQFIIGHDWEMSEYLDRRDKKQSAKLWNFEQIRDSQNKLTKRNSWNDSSMNYAIKRWQQTAKSQHAAPFTMTPEWRFAVGLGEKNALENGLTFHRIYGFPIIPGSALKGLARAVALWEIAEALGVPRLGLSQIKTLGDNEKSPLQKLEVWLLQSSEEMIKQTTFILDQTQRNLVEKFRQIFGTQHAAGGAIFFDAMPAEAPKLEVDVMNVHYPDYYGEQSTKPPSDDQNPNPIPFLTVGQTPFWFAVGWRGHQADTALQKQAQTWLQVGLTEFGIGAKTAAGYGYFGK